MDIQTLWIVALSIATPIAGVVGFSIQLRQVKKTRLENEKLQLEILALREKAANAERLIVKATTDEVLKFTAEPRYGRALESRISYSELLVDVGSARPRKASLREKVINTALISALVLLLGYFIYDVYRLFTWILSKI